MKYCYCIQLKTSLVIFFPLFPVNYVKLAFQKHTVLWGQTRNLLAISFDAASLLRPQIVVLFL